MTTNKSYDVIGAMKSRKMYSAKDKDCVKNKKSKEFVSIDKIEETYGVRFTIPNALAELMLVKAPSTKH